MLLNRKAFQKWGAIGGRTRAARLSKARRKQIAKTAVKAREEKRKVGRPLGSTGGKVNIVEAVALYKSGNTLAVVGKHFGVTRERIRQLLVDANITSIEGGRFITSFINAPVKIKRQQEIEERKSIRLFNTYGLTTEQYEEISKTLGPPSDSNSPLNKYRSQKNSAKDRGILWNITFSEWWHIWNESGKWKQRGRGKGYCMTRIGDTGAYAADNVEIKTIGENFSEAYYKHPWKERFPNHTGPRKSHCKNGHIRSADNVDSQGRCRLCLKSRKKTLYAERKNNG